MRRAARVDENQPDIVSDLRLLPGVTVCVLSRVGDGCPDLLVGYRGANFLFEVKDPTKPKADQQLTDAQAMWHGAWTGQVRVVHSFVDVLNFLTGRYWELATGAPHETP